MIGRIPLPIVGEKLVLRLWNACLTNGTYVNRRRIESHRLSDADEIQIGKYKLSFLER